jgi:hypothetical protein
LIALYKVINLGFVVILVVRATDSSVYMEREAEIPNIGKLGTLLIITTIRSLKLFVVQRLAVFSRLLSMPSVFFSARAAAQLQRS